MSIPHEAEHMELLEEELLFALVRAENAIGGLELANAVDVPARDAYPALHKLVQNGYAHQDKRLYTSTPAGMRLASELASRQP